MGGDDVCSPWLLWQIFFLGRCVGYDGPVHRYGGYHLICHFILFCCANLPRGPTRVDRTLVDLCHGGLVLFQGTR